LTLGHNEPPKAAAGLSGRRYQEMLKVAFSYDDPPFVEKRGPLAPYRN